MTTADEPEEAEQVPAGPPRRDAVAEERKRQRWLNLLVPTSAIMSIATAVLVVLVYFLVGQNDGLSKALTAQRQQAQQSGQTPVAKPPAQVKANPGQPTVSPAPEATGPRGPGPTTAQVQAAVYDVLLANPQWLHVQPDSATLLADVDNWLAKHAPTALAPTPAQVYDAVLAVYTAHPPAAGSPGATGPAGPAGSTGPQGEKGDKGDPPTAEEIAQAVSDWLAAHPLPVCPDGTSAQAHTWLTLDAGTISAVVCEKTSGS